MRKLGKIMLCGLAISLGGCASNVFDVHESAASQALFRPNQSLVTRISGNYALASLPSSIGQVVEVDEERFDNGVSQKIVLAGGNHGRGNNGIDISVEVQPEGAVIRNHLITLAPTDDVTIANELQTRFPGIDMKIVPVLLRNQYGPYGMAAGTARDGDRCIYAWQWIDDFGHANNDQSTSLVRGLVSPRQPVSLRIQLCRRGVSADQLAGLVNDLSLAGSDGIGLPVLWHPGLGVGTGLRPQSLQPNTALVGGEFSGYQMPHENLRMAEPAQARPRRKVHVAAKPKKLHLQPYRERTAAKPAAQPAQVEPVQVQMQPQLTPSYGQPASPQGMVPAYANRIVAPPAAKFDLPPEAYAGPGGAAAMPSSGAAPGGVSQAMPQGDGSQLLRLRTLQDPSI